MNNKDIILRDAMGSMELWGRSNKIKYVKNESFNYIESDVPFMMFNTILYKEDITQEVAEKVTAIATKAPTQFAWYAGCYDTPEFKKMLETLGWTFVEFYTGMLLDISQSSALKKTTREVKIAIRKVSTEEEFKSFSTISADGFEIPQFAREAWLDLSTEMTKSGKCIHYIGYADINGENKPVSTATLLLIGEHSSYIPDVATQSDCRKKGYATAMLRHVIQQAHEMKRKTMTLAGEKNAVGIYSRLGFKPHCNLPLYFFEQNKE